VDAVIRGSGWVSAFVLIRQMRAVAASHAIDLANDADRFGDQFERHGIAVFVSFECGMQLPTCENTVVSDPKLFYLFEVKKSLAVR
jgi:hypothetical protein